MTVESIGAIPAATRAESPYRAVAAAGFGHLLEWYDFIIYAYAASIIAKLFFPSGSELGSLLLAFLVFGIGFLARPLGAMVLGPYADRKGRKATLILSLYLMAGGTLLIALTPSYATIGVAAPLIIAAARLIQGFSVGGEASTSTAFIVEWAPEGKRGLYGSFQQWSAGLGILLGSVVFTIISKSVPQVTLEDWAWRIPFLIGGLLAPIGMWLRLTIGETPKFEEALATSAPAPSIPFGGIGRAFGYAIPWSVAYYIILSYSPTFMIKSLQLKPDDSFVISSIALVAFCGAVPLFGNLSDKVGRKPIVIAACLLTAVCTYPMYAYMLQQKTFAAALIGQTVLIIILAMYSGVGPALITEQFPTKNRLTWMATAYSISVAISGGFAPYIATWLTAATGDVLSPTWYVIGTAIFGLLLVFAFSETAKSKLA